MFCRIWWFAIGDPVPRTTNGILSRFHCPQWLRFRGLQGDEREFGRTEKAHGQLDGADAAVDIELQRTQFEVALDEAPAAGRQHVPRRSNEGQTHLAAVGVAGEQKT